MIDLILFAATFGFCAIYFPWRVAVAFDWSITWHDVKYSKYVGGAVVAVYLFVVGLAVEILGNWLNLI